MAKKRVIKVRVHPNTRTIFEDDNSWEVSGPAAMQLTDYKNGKAYCIELGPTPTFSVYEVAENGDFGCRTHYFRINKGTSEKD